MTEILSVFHLINRISLSLFWIAILAVGITICIIKAGGTRELLNNIVTKVRNIANILRDDPLMTVATVLGVLSIVIAIATVPYNHDSMTYHLARVAHWAKNGSVGHYATNILRQVSSPVMAEIMALQIYVIFGHHSSLCNIIQSLSFIIISITIYKIGMMIGLNKKVVMVSVIIFMTMPIAFAESVTTQNDLFAAMWYMFFALEMIAVLLSEKKLGFDRETLFWVLSMSSLVAMIYLSKPSAGFGVIVMVILSIPILWMRKEKIGVLISCGFVAAITFVAIILPEVLRNLKTFGSLTDGSVSKNIMVATLDPRYLFINFLKNFTFNLPTRLSMYLTMGLGAFMNNISRLMGVPLNDPSISFNPEYQYNDPLIYNHDYSINPLTEWCVILGVITLIFCIGKMQKIEKIRLYIILSGILSFCAFCTVLRWQVWGTRLMLPYLTFLCLVIGVILDETRKISNIGEFLDRAVIPVILFLAISGGINSVALQTKCALKRNWGIDKAMYASVQPDQYEAEKEMTDRIIADGYKNVAMVCNGSGYDFPIMSMLDGKIDQYYHLIVLNPTDKYMMKEAPDCIIFERGVPEETVTVNGSDYEIELVTGMGCLLRRNGK